MSDRHNPDAVRLSSRDFPELRQSTARVWIAANHAAGGQVPLALPPEDPEVVI